MWYISLAKGPSTDPVLCFLICIETCLKHKFPLIFFSVHKIFFVISPNLNKLLKIQNTEKRGNLYSEEKCCTILCIHHTFFSRLKHYTFSFRKTWGWEKKKEKKSILSLPWFAWRLGIAEEVLLHGMVSKDIFTRRQEGIPALWGHSWRCWPWASRALTPAWLLRWARVWVSQTQSAPCMCLGVRFILWFTHTTQWAPTLPPWLLVHFSMRLLDNYNLNTSKSDQKDFSHS